jgi:hypothetical protein
LAWATNHPFQRAAFPSRKSLPALQSVKELGIEYERCGTGLLGMANRCCREEAAEDDGSLFHREDILFIENGVPITRSIFIIFFWHF